MYWQSPPPIRLSRGKNLETATRYGGFQRTPTGWPFNVTRNFLDDAEIQLDMQIARQQILGQPDLFFVASDSRVVPDFGHVTFRPGMQLSERCCSRGAPIRG